VAYRERVNFGPGGPGRCGAQARRYPVLSPLRRFLYRRRLATGADWFLRSGPGRAFPP
jgi:hypothetical protein